MVRDGNNELINLMPRSLQWHSFLHRYRYLGYILSVVFFLLGCISIYLCITSYQSYRNQVGQWCDVKNNRQYVDVRQKYDTVMSLRNQILQRDKGFSHNAVIICILDLAMNQEISLNHLAYKNGHISIDGEGISDERCRAFLDNVQHRLTKIECHGTVKANKGKYTFHMDGSEGEHNATGGENHGSASALDNP